jgi:hypothetical protein
MMRNKDIVGAIVTLHRPTLFLDSDDNKAPAGTQCYVASTFQGKFSLRRAGDGRWLKPVRREDFTVIFAVEL